MNQILRLSVFITLFAGYFFAVCNLNEVKLFAGDIVTPVMNHWALLSLTMIGLIIGFLLFKTDTDSFLSESDDRASQKGRSFFYLIIILALFKFSAFFLSPRFIQFMHIWPDSVGYLGEIQLVLKDPTHLFDRRSPVFTLWLLFNHLTFGRLIDGDLTQTHFGTEVHLSDVIPPLVLQNTLGLFSAGICFFIFSRISARFAFAVTALTFLNPTSLSLDNAITRESISIFFILAGMALFIVTLEHNKPFYALCSGLLFVFAYQTRPELLIVAIILGFALFLHVLMQKRGRWSLIVLFSLPLVASLVASASFSSNREYVNNSYGGKFIVALHGLKSKCYSYKSREFPDLIKNFQKRVRQCRSENMSPCDGPAPTIFTLISYLDEEIGEYQALGRKSGDPGASYSRGQILDRVFMEIVKDNTACYAKSFLANVGYNLSHHVQNMVPVFYEGNQKKIRENWAYYASPQMLAVYEKSGPAQKVVVFLFRAIELHMIRAILFPFFFIGTFIILKANRNKCLGSTDNIFLLKVVLVLAWVHLLFLSVAVDAVARFIYPISPFIFAVQVAGVIGVHRWCKKYFGEITAWLERISLGERRRYQVGCCLGLIVLLISIEQLFIHKKSPYALWDMDAIQGGGIADSRKKHDAAGFNIGIVDGYSGKAAYFNGQDSFIQTSLDFHGWEILTIAFWIKPEKKEGDDLSFILDGGHSGPTGLSIHSADASGEKWVLSLNGAEIGFNLPLNEWSHVVATADGSKKEIDVSVNENTVMATKLRLDFPFSDTPIAIGKQIKANGHYFKGSLDEIKVFQ